MKTFKLKIYSLGGQGIRSMVTKLEKTLNHRQDLFFTSLVKYDGVIKGGMVETNIVVSEKKGKSPFFQKANLCICLTEVKSPIACNEKINVKDSEILETDLEKKVLGYF